MRKINIEDININNAPIETERKYLIKYPEIEKLALMPSYSCIHIEQTYFKKENGDKCRVRKITDNHGVKYIFTQKEKISELSRYEFETQISKEEYKNLLLLKMPESNMIVKDRHTFFYNNQKYEVDVYEFWSDKATMEAETENEDTQVPIPPCVTLIKEVTFDKRYRNSSLAKNHIF